MVVFSNIKQDYSDSKEEVESVSEEEEDGEEHNPEHDGTSSSEVEEISHAKDRHEMVLCGIWQRGKMAEHKGTEMTPGPTTMLCTMPLMF